MTTLNNVANFNWFLTAYETVFNKYPIEIEDHIKAKIDLLFAENGTSYRNFVEQISTIFQLDDKQKQIFLQQEEFCICCKTRYPVTFDPFIIYQDIDTKEDITFNLCNMCNKFTNCTKCDYIIDGPYNKFYFNIADKTTICDFCYNNKKKPEWNKRVR
jgi:hypothetical protein